MSDSNVAKLRLTEDLKGRVAIITGATRGIGRECALALARLGVNIVVAAKSTEEMPSLPGSIYSVANEVEACGAQALPFKLDLRDADAIEACVKSTVEKFGRVDILINNASALWWHTVVDTPRNKYDLITQINARGSFLMTRACLPHMAKNSWGRIINTSPPIKTNFRAFKGFTAYNISKFGMTMVAMGAAAENEGKGICANSLWPATVVESQASINFQMGDRDFWRKATILSDCVVGMCGTSGYTGHMCIDDTYLQNEHGFTAEDLKIYRCNPDVDPFRALAGDGMEEMGVKGDALRIGDVKKISKQSKIPKMSKL